MGLIARLFFMIDAMISFTYLQVLHYLHMI
jgi:hypothetical protein